MKTMRRTELAVRISARCPAVPLIMRNGQSTRGQSIDVGNVRGPINWQPSSETILAEADRLGVVAVED